MKEKTSSSMEVLCKTLVRPDMSFASGKYLKSSLLFLMLMLYFLALLSTMGGRLIMERPELVSFSENIALRNVESKMHGCSEEQIEVAKQNTLKGMNSPIGKIAAYISVCITTLFVFFGVLVFWLFQIIVLKFMGGEEDPTTVEKKKKTKIYKNRKSLYLSVIAAIPSAIYSVVGLLIVFFRDPKTMVNVLSMKELMDSFNVRISLSGIFLSDFNLPIFFRNLLDNLTGPFYWWFLIVAWFGLKHVWHLDSKKTSIFLSIWVIVSAAFYSGYEYFIAGLF